MGHVRHSCNQKGFSFTFFSVLAMLATSTPAIAISPADTQESHPGLANESRYAEAVVAYTRKQTKEALKILDELIQGSPKNIEYLEMKALTLKGTGDEKSSIQVYQQLFEAKPDAERGPYAFEIGTLLNKQNRFEEARPYFEKAAALNFNAGVANLFLGIGNFNANRFTEAQVNFDQVAGVGIPEVELIAQYYKSLCFFKLYLSTRGVQEVLEARDLARKAVKKDAKNTNAQNILDASDKMLEPFSKGQWFGNASFSTQYDSNIQQIPVGVANTQVSKNNATIKENILAGLGYMSAPANLIQLVAGYRASYNKNFNSELKNFEFFTNNASLFFNYRPLARISFGLKLEGNFMFQNSPIDSSDTNGAYEFQKFNSTYGGGGFIRYQLTDYWRLDGETNYRNQKYYEDDDQSGSNTNFSLALRKMASDRYFNPGFSAVYEMNNANGTSVHYRALGFGINNVMNFPALLTVTQGIDLLSTNYDRLSPARDDQNWSFRLGAMKFITPKISVNADLNYIKNASNLPDSYSYNRFMTSVGIGFML
jgi:tetratricopeptide (TPR) repeat protein